MDVKVDRDSPTTSGAGAADNEAANGNNYEKISTAKPTQSSEPRTLSESIVVDEVKANPSGGRELDLTGDSRYSPWGWQKMEQSHKTPDGNSITIHYQTKGDAVSDIKITTKEPSPTQPRPSFIKRDEVEASCSVTTVAGCGE